MLNEKLIISKGLYSYDGLVIKNPKYYIVTYSTKNFFGNAQFGAYTPLNNANDSNINVLGDTMTFILPVAQNKTISENYSPRVNEEPFMGTGGDLYMFIGAQWEIYSFCNA